MDQHGILEQMQQPTPPVMLTSHSNQHVHQNMQLVINHGEPELKMLNVTKIIVLNHTTI